MHFYQRIPPQTLNLNYNGEKIDQVQVGIFLGIIMIDSQLTWKPHAEEVCNKISTAAYVLLNLSRKVNICLPLD